MALQMLYQGELGHSTDQEVVAGFLPLRAGESDTYQELGRLGLSPKAIQSALDYARTLFLGVSEHRDEIDEMVRAQAENWRLERMPAVDRNILRLAVYELAYQSDVPKLVILDEAIELAKRFGSENSGRFVNGVLDGLLKSHSFPGTLT